MQNEEMPLETFSAGSISTRKQLSSYEQQTVIEVKI